MIVRIIVLMIITSLLAGCGSGGSTSQSQEQSGSVALKLVVEKNVAAVTGNICTDSGVATITVNFLSATGTLASQRDFACSSHQGVLNGIPAQSDYTVVVYGTRSDNTVAVRGTKSNISIAANTTNDLGTFSLTAVQ